MAFAFRVPSANSLLVGIVSVSVSVIPVVIIVMLVMPFSVPVVLTVFRP
jgi:hypothetical protein